MNLVGYIQYQRVKTKYGYITLKITKKDNIFKAEIVESHTKLCVFTEIEKNCVPLAINAFEVSLNLWLTCELTGLCVDRKRV